MGKLFIIYPLYLIYPATKTNPFNPYGPIPPENLAGRVKEIEEFKIRLKSTMRGTPQHMTVMGERGIGKTSLLRKFEQIAHDEDCVVVRIDLHSAIESLDQLLYNVHEEVRKVALHYYGLLGRAYKKIQRFLENYSLVLPYGGVEQIRQQPIQTVFFDRMLEMWSNVSEKVSAVVIMIDEAEQLASITGSLEFLRNTFSRLGERNANYCVVISGKLGLFQTVSEVFSPLERFFSPISLNPFTKEEVVEAIEKALEGEPMKFSGEVIDRINNESEGQPYVVQIFGYWLYEAAEQKEIAKVDLKVFEDAREKVYSVLQMQLFQRRLAEGAGRSKYKAAIMKKLARHQGDEFSFTEIEKISGVKKNKD
jgi:Cdc6-like AAA superfamily ATPase